MDIKEYNVYIDESGDEGINKGSRYFILTAIIVEREKDLITSQKVDEIKFNLEMNIKSQLHWKLIKGYPNKKMIMETIKDLDIKIINVIVDTKCIKLIPSNNIYNYFSGYLYERICWYMNEVNGIANINISSRGNLSKKSLSEYLNSNNHKKFEIDSSKIKSIKIIPNERKKLLQLADCCCSALFQALKYNDETHFKYIVNGKIKCRKSVKINVGFPTFLISVTITIEVIVNMSMENGNKLRNMLKEMIRLNIKPNFAALGREYGCDYRTAKVKYYEEQNKEKGIEIAKKERKYIIDDYKELIINKLETVPGITAYSIYYFLKVEKGYNGSYETIKNFVRSNKDKRKQPASIRVEPIIGKSAQVDWKEDFKLTNKDGELFVINLFLIRLHYSKKFYARLTIDKKRDEVKKCIVESLEYFGGTPREIWFDNMATVMVKEGKHKKVHNEIKQLGNDIGFQPILCQARRPKSKGTVENLAKLCDRLKSYNNEFETLDDLINIVNKFNEECGNEKSQAHNKIVNEVFEDEKKYLIPLPNKNILEKYKQNIEYRKVSQDSMIVYRGNRYSVPTRFIGSYLGIRIINNQVYIYDNTDLVRCHVITNNNLNYHNEDKIEILKSDLLYGLDDKEIENKINNTDLQIYDFLKGMNYDVK